MKTVTIAIPTLNRAEYLRSAISSALNQTYGALEVLVSDNASTDHTFDVLAEFATDSRLRVLRQPVTVSMVNNWNLCITAATGDYFLLLSDDDLLDPEAVSTLVAGFAADAQVGIVYCRARMINERGETILIGPPAPGREPAEGIMRNFFRSQRLTWACTILFRTEDIWDGYSDQFPLATDAALWMRVVVQRGQAVFVNRILASYRTHQNISAKTPTAVWQRENWTLAQYAVGLLQSAGRSRPGDERTMLAACKRLNVRLVCNLLNQNHKRKRLAGLRAYGRQWRDFMSLYGVGYAAKGILQLLFPDLSSTVGRLRSRLKLPDERQQGSSERVLSPCR